MHRLTIIVLACPLFLAAALLAAAPQTPPLTGQIRTGPDGTADFTGFPTNSAIRFQAQDDHFAELSFNDDVEITSPAATSKSIRLTTAVEASGTVTYADTGKPAPGIRLNAQSVDRAAMGYGDAITDAAGHYQINRLTPAQYVVELSSDNTSNDWVAAAAVVDLQNGSNTQTNLSLVHGGILTGKVRDSKTGIGFPGLFVGLHGPAHPGIAGEIQSATTDADGYAQWQSPVPAPPHTLTRHVQMTITLKKAATTQP